EVLISVMLGMIILSMVLSMWYYAYKNWTLDRIRTNLKVNLEIAIERIKEEIRLSSATHISLYKPVSETEYKAISFPVAEPDVNGFFALDNEDNIDWDNSVIYHVYQNPATSNTEFRRTEFTDNHDVLIDKTQRDAQLASVVADGDGSGAVNSVNATTKVIFTSLAELTIAPKAQEFDGYSPTVKRSDNISFGSVRLESGNHDLKFEVTNKNTSSTGYGMGIDNIAITPSGCQREAEVYTPQDTSGDSDSVSGPDVAWSGNYFLEYNSNDVGDYITLRLYYDAYLECNFNNSMRENTLLLGDALYVKLPDFEEGYEAVWNAEIEAGSASGDGQKTDFTLPLDGITIRNVISKSNIDIASRTSDDYYLVRVKFESHSPAISPDTTIYQLTIGEAYLDRKFANEDCVSPFVTTTPGETRIKLYFTNAGNDVSQSTTISQGSSTYSNWVIFPIEFEIGEDYPKYDYFVTFYIQKDGDENPSYASCWAGTNPPDINSYLMGGNHAAQALWASPTDYLGHEATPPFADGKYTSSAHVYAQATVEVWSNEGSVTSEIYDTKVANPNYAGSIERSESEPSGSSITVYGRSSDDPLMAGASWSSESVSGSGRYVQFRADLLAAPHWTSISDSSLVVTDIDYKNNNVILDASGEFLVPGIYCPWIDNVKIKWPGSTMMCDISGYFAQKPDYGIIKLTVDGEELLKGLELRMTVSEDFQGKTYESFIATEVEPRNTAK
ncbi:MAG: hypothetical protein ISS91_00795, partial [Candidatus Omnitrophica bacterium]|nr:hypothetical protein [Candidatus Omnitrophota bacterium]